MSLNPGNAGLPPGTDRKAGQKPGAPGYKQTEVGVIPEDWDVLSVDRVFQFKQGVQCPIEGQSTVAKEGFRRFIRIIDLTTPEEEWRYIPDPGKLHHVDPTDLFMVRYGSPGLMGIGYDGVIANNLFRLLPRRLCDSDFFYQYLTARQPAIMALSGSSTMPAIKFSTLNLLPVVYPPPTEQRAIAEALSDVDGLLGGLDRLIAKKRDLKQAAMQQLLTAQTRLPGFHGEWRAMQLGTIAEVLKGSGLSKSSVSSTGHTPCLLYGELFTTYNRVIYEVVSRTSSVQGIPSKTGDVLLPGSTTTSGRDLAVASALMVNGVALGGDINILRAAGNNYESRFLAYYLTEAKKQAIAQAAQGITIYHLYGRDLKEIELTLPPIAEQTAIAEVLGDMDAELAALARRREKTRALKQAMMQQLLTGQIRLV